MPGDGPFRYPPRWINDARPPDAYRIALRELAASLRELTAAVSDTTASRHELEQFTAQARALLDRMRVAPSGRTRAGYGKVAEHDSERAFLDTSPIIGLANPVAPPMRMWVDGEAICGVVTFGAAYEGPPGHVHGGFLAATFDDVLGAAQSATGKPGMTASLALKYRNPTPLGREARFRGWIDHVVGRKIHTRGTLHVGETLCAEAEATFISVDFRAMHEQVQAGTFEGKPPPPH
jgi:acyl-coenzyme A thioesterase PaaI-like protein